MSEIRFRELLKKYLEGSATPEEQKLVDDWYTSLADKDELHLPDSERAALRNHYWRSLKEEIRSNQPKQRRLWPAIAIAASIAAVVLSLFYYIEPADEPVLTVVEATPVFAPQSIENNTSAVRVVALSDSSIVQLWPGSSIVISDSFNLSDRSIELSGQAFFDIAHNEAKPFYVFANEVVTKVLGTSFVVTAYPQDVEIKVAVKTGKVSVYTHPETMSTNRPSPNVVLKPNQQAIYRKDDRKVVRELVDDPQVVISEEEVKKIRFEGVSVSEIFLALEKMYGVEIDFSEADFAKCLMTTSATGEDLYEKIAIICEIAGAEYTANDGYIRITGSGCN